MEWPPGQAQIFAVRKRSVRERVDSGGELSGEDVGLSHSTIRAQGAVAEVRGRCRIRSDLVVVSNAGAPDAPLRGHRRWTAFTRFEVDGIRRYTRASVGAWAARVGR
jgi:hypothetical protein